MNKNLKTKLSKDISEAVRSVTGRDPTAVAYGDADGGKIPVTVTVKTRFGDVAAVTSYDETLMANAETNKGAAQFVADNAAAAVSRRIVEQAFT